MKTEAKLTRPEVVIKITAQNQFFGSGENWKKIVLRKVQNLISKNVEIVAIEENKKG